MFTLVVCATTSAWAAASPKATVVWNGDFGTTTKTGRDGDTYTFTLNPTGNTGDNLNTLSGGTDGNLVIGSGSTYGGQIAWNHDTSQVYTSVIIKYSNFTAEGSKVLAAVSAKTTTGTNSGQIVDDCVGVLSASGSTLTGRYNANTSTWPNNGNSVATSYASGYLLIVYGSGQAFQFYTSSDGITWAGGTASGLTFGTTYSCGVGLGGMSGSASASGYGVSAGMTIEAVAIFRGYSVSTSDISTYSLLGYFSSSSYEKWYYAKDVFTWHSDNATQANIGSSGSKVTVFSPTAGADTSVNYNCGGNTGYSGSDFWHTFCYGKSTYYTPGCVLRVTSNHASKQIKADFNPLALGGLIIENGANGVDFYNDSSSRQTILGAATGNKETWFGIYDNATISRSGYLKLSGTVNLEVSKGKTFTISAANSPTIVEALTAANGTSTSGGTLKMHGLGKLAVSTLTATGGATLDFSDVQEDADVVRSTTPFIQGNLTIDSTTKFVFPAGLAKNTAYTLCSGTLTAPASVICDITVGTTVKKNVPLTFSGNTVSYGDAVYAATVDGTTVTWDGDEPSSFDDIVVTFSGSGTVEGLSGSGTTINAADGVTVDVTSLTSPTLLGTGTFRYTSGYPTTIPSAEYSYEYVGGATDAEKVTVPDALTINGKLKTSGYIALTGANTLAAGGSLEVLSDKTELAAVQGVQANSWSGGLGGTITVDANAELASLTNDALTRSGSVVNINVYGTLNLGTTRWTMQSSLYHRLNLHGNAEVKGSGDGAGILDFENANSSVNINVYDGTPTISGPLKFRAKTITWIASNAKLAVIGGTIENGEFAKSGAGTLSFSAVAPSTTGGLSASEGTIELDNISYTAGTITISSSSESPTLKMIATDAATTVSATVNVPANTRGQLAFEGAGTFALSGPNRNDNIVWLGTNPVPGTLQLNGNVTINNGSVNTDYRFNKLGSGSSTLSLATWSGCYDKNGNPGLGYTFDTIDADAFTGTIALSNSATDSHGGCTMNFSAGNIIKSSAVYGTPLVKVTKAVGARTDSYSNAINVSATQFNGNAAEFVYDDSVEGSEGIYLAEASYNGVSYKTLALAIAAMETAEGDPADVIVYNSAATIPSGYALVGGTRLRKGGETIYWTSGTYWAASGGSAVFSTALSDGEATTYAAGDTVVIPDTKKRWYGPISDGAKIVFSCGGTIDVEKTGDLGYAFKNADITIESGTIVNFMKNGYSVNPEVNGGSISGEGAITVANGATLDLSGVVELGITPSGGTVNVASGAKVSCTGAATISSTLAGSGEVSFATLPSSALTLGDWTGTVELPLLTDNQAYQLNNYGKTGSTIRLNGLSAGWLAVATPITVNANLELAGDWNLSAMSTRVYNFATVSGTGNMSFATAQNHPTSINIATLSGYTGTITNNTTATLTIGTLALDSDADVSAGAKLLSTGGTGEFSVTAVTVGGEAQTLNLSYRSDGVYVRASVASYDNVEYETIAEAIAAAEQAGNTYADVTILDENATCPDEYYIDNGILAKKPAAVCFSGALTYYTTAEAAFAAAYMSTMGTNPTGYDYMIFYANATITAFDGMKIKPVSGVTVTINATSAEYAVTPGEADESGVVTYTVANAPTTYTWTDAWNDTDYQTYESIPNHDWTMSANWSFNNGTVATRYPGAADTVIIGDGANITGVSSPTSVAVMQVSGAVTISGGGTLTSDSAITLGASDSITITGTLSPIPTTNVSHSRVKAVTVGSTTTYSVEAIPGTIFSVW